MPGPIHHARILSFPFAANLRGARLTGLREETRLGRHDLVMTFDELRLLAEPELLLDQGHLLEHVRGEWVARQLRFGGLTMLNRKGLFTHLDDLPPEHGARSLRGALYWRPPGQPDASCGLFLLVHGGQEPATLLLSPASMALEECGGEPQPADLRRDWSPAPPLVPGMVPAPLGLRLRYGGDPVSVTLDGQAYHFRLFVGGVEEQPPQRPRVDFVLNLGEEPSRWVYSGAQAAALHPGDRWSCKGEGSLGMNCDEITAEAQWVIDRLRAGQRGLVHCSAGFNRSVTVCCAVLILLEGLTAEAALARVRRHHPWAFPDSHHWLALRWLAQMKVAGHSSF